MQRSSSRVLVARSQNESSPNPRRDRRAIPRRSRASATRTCASVLLIACFFSAASLFAGSLALAADAAVTTKSLDEQVQEIKSDVLAIAAELGNLEEKLLYPSNTQVALFVALAAGDTLTIDSARISIDGELVAHHIYSFKELDALRRGGVQRIYTGNLPTGAHRLEIAIAGKRGGDDEFESIETFQIEKEVDPKLVGITLSGGKAGGAPITIEDW